MYTWDIEPYKIFTFKEVVKKTIDSRKRLSTKLINVSLHINNVQITISSKEQYPAFNFSNRCSRCQVRTNKSSHAHDC